MKFSQSGAGSGQHTWTLDRLGPMTYVEAKLLAVSFFVEGSFEDIDI